MTKKICIFFLLLLISIISAPIALAQNVGELSDARCIIRFDEGYSTPEAPKEKAVAIEYDGQLYYLKKEKGTGIFTTSEEYVLFMGQQLRAGQIYTISGKWEKGHIGKGSLHSLVVSKIEFVAATSIGAATDGNAFSIHSLNGALLIESATPTAYSVYNILGAVVHKGVARGQETLHLPKGIYIVERLGKCTKVVL